ncbi:MAG: ATP-binding protein [Rubrivivax sp.]|nr:ATP-binding protein [Rubrivivax sp.]
MSGALRIAVVGAESTGKTTLAAALAEALGRQGSRRVAWVPEVLREWCDARGRTPAAHEQAAIARAQHERIAEAAAAHDIVVSDTTALMTAVYSRIVFGDRTLDAMAVELHRSVDATLLSALDLPWVPDGHQRDGPQVQRPVDDALRELLRAHRLPFAVVGGQGPARLAQALAAVAALLPQGREALAGPAPGRGLFSALTGETATHRGWRCECCVPEAEQALMPRR